jgi:hypothetical protein
MPWAFLTILHSGAAGELLTFLLARHDAFQRESISSIPNKLAVIPDNWMQAIGLPNVISVPIRAPIPISGLPECSGVQNTLPLFNYRLMII